MRNCRLDVVIWFLNSFFFWSARLANIKIDNDDVSPTELGDGTCSISIVSFTSSQVSYHVLTSASSGTLPETNMFVPENRLGPKGKDRLPTTIWLKASWLGLSLGQTSNKSKRGLVRNMFSPLVALSTRRPSFTVLQVCHNRVFLDHPFWRNGCSQGVLRSCLENGAIIGGQYLCVDN